MMAIKLIVLVACVRLGAGDVLQGAAPANVSKADAATALVHADPALYSVYQIHRAFVDALELRPPHHYSYGYEVYNWKTGLTTSHYESRYTDVGVGTHVLLAPSGSRATVDYTVDSARGFHGVVRRDVEGRQTRHGYASLAGRLAFETRRALEGYERGSGHALAQQAKTVRDGMLRYFDLEPPYRYSWGYQARDADGRTRSQFESGYGATSEGSLAVISKDGAISSVEYNVDENGLSVSSPVSPLSSYAYTSLH